MNNKKQAIAKKELQAMYNNSKNRSTNSGRVKDGTAKDSTGNTLKRKIVQKDIEATKLQQEIEQKLMVWQKNIGNKQANTNEVEIASKMLYDTDTLHLNMSKLSDDKVTSDLLLNSGFTYRQRVSNDKVLVDTTKRIKINGTTAHFIDNLKNKEGRQALTVDECQRIVDNAILIIYQQDNNVLKYISDTGYVVLNFNNKIITAVPQKWRNEYNKYLKE